MRDPSPYWGEPENAPIHPYKIYEGTPAWESLKKALMDLDQNQDIDLTEWYQYIIGYLCKQLEQDNVIKW
jgi:hypothetical protein